jgi:3-oxoadipate enol-lactonase
MSDPGPVRLAASLDGPAGGERSPDPPGAYSIAGLGADVLALLDRFELDRVLYCGVSLGAMIGMWLAAEAPRRIGGLALCCTSAWLPPARMWLDRAAVVRASGPGAIAGQVSRWFTPAAAAHHGAHAGHRRGGLRGAGRSLRRADMMGM